MWGEAVVGAPRPSRATLEAGVQVGAGSLSQEAEPKGKAAVSGEKVKSGDVKKPDRGHRGDAAAPKGEGGQKELKADTQEVPSR